MVSAIAVLPHDRPAEIEPRVMEFLNSTNMLHWAEITPSGSDASFLPPHLRLVHFGGIECAGRGAEFFRNYRAFSTVGASLRARQQAFNATYILPIANMWPYYRLPISYQIATNVVFGGRPLAQRPILGRRFTEVERSRRCFPRKNQARTRRGGRSHTPEKINTLDRMPGFAQSQQKSPAQDRASSAAAAIGSQTSDRLPNVAKSPRQYHRRDAGRPLLRQAMRLPPRA